MDDQNVNKNGSSDGGQGEGDSGADKPLDSKWFMPGWPTAEDGDSSGEPASSEPPVTGQTNGSSVVPPPLPRVESDSNSAEEAYVIPPERPATIEELLSNMDDKPPVPEKSSEPADDAAAAAPTETPEAKSEPATEQVEEAAPVSEQQTDEPTSGNHDGGWKVAGAWSYADMEDDSKQEAASDDAAAPVSSQPDEPVEAAAPVASEPDEPVESEPEAPAEEPAGEKVEPEWVQPSAVAAQDADEPVETGGGDVVDGGGVDDVDVPIVSYDEEPKGPRKGLKAILIGAIVLAVVAAVACGIIFLVVPKAKSMDRSSNEAIAIYIALGVVLAAIISWFLLRKTLRSRLLVEKTIRADPDINDWLIVFDWTPKVLYVPTICAAFIAAILMYLEQSGVWVFARLDPTAIGGIWCAIFFLNYIVEEYNVSIKILIILSVGLGCFLMWLNLLGGVMTFLKLFTNLAVEISAMGFLLIGIFGLLSICVSWIKGLFYYITITPNYMNVQEGPTESGEQIGREDYNSRIDTSDFVERLMGFGRIIITFKDQKRQPLTMLVWRINKRAKLLERVRGKIAIDRPVRHISSS